MHCKANIKKKQKLNHHYIVNPSAAITENNNEKSYLLILPCAGAIGEKLITLLKESIKIILPENLVTKTRFLAIRLSNRFKIKTQINK